MTFFSISCSCFTSNSFSNIFFNYSSILTVVPVSTTEFHSQIQSLYPSHFSNTIILLFQRNTAVDQGNGSFGTLVQLLSYGHRKYPIQFDLRPLSHQRKHRKSDTISLNDCLSCLIGPVVPHSLCVSFLSCRIKFTPQKEEILNLIS